MKRSSMMPTTKGTFNADEVPDDDSINTMYVTVLDQLLTPPAIKERLVQTQSIQQKWKFVKVHYEQFEKGVTWGSKQQELMSEIDASRAPDLQIFSSLRVMLASANREFMMAFLDAGGVSCLMKAILQRVPKKAQSELNIAALFEIMLCCKLVMNNAIGMNGFMKVQGSLDAVALCLKFEYKYLALQVLEILSVCCYSEQSTSKVIHGMRVLAKSEAEVPFSCLSYALVDEDIEAKSAVMLFVKTMMMSCSMDDLVLLRSELNSVRFDTQYELTLEKLEEDLQAPGEELVQRMTPKRGELKAVSKAAAVDATPPPNSASGKRKPFTPNPTDVQSAAANAGVSLTNRAARRRSSFTPMTASGSMQGAMVTVSSTKNMFSGNKIGSEKRWYEVDFDFFRCGSTADKPRGTSSSSFKRFSGSSNNSNDSRSPGPNSTSSGPNSPGFERSIPIETIIDVRPSTTDSNMEKAVGKLKLHPLEIELKDGSVLVLGCEDMNDRDRWVFTIRANSDQHQFMRSSYRHQVRELTPDDIFKAAETFRRHGKAYLEISSEGKKFTMEACGIDISDFMTVAKYLYHELQASGLSGKLLLILQEFLLVPAGSDMTWDAILTGIRRLRSANLREAGVVETSFDTKSFVQLLKDKVTDEGQGYAQMSKLALQAMEKDEEVRRLKEQLETAQGSGQKVKELTAEEAKQRMEEAKAFAEVQQLQEKVRNLEEEVAALKAGGAVAAAPTIDPRYEKYVKMKKMLPAGAVKQKMTADGFTEEEIENFMSGKMDTPAAAPAAAPAADPRYEKYVKMKKMLPEGAVRQKMTADGFTADEIDAFMSGATAPAAAAPAAAPAADPRYEKYAKMKKMLPEGAVRQKMAADGFTAEEVDAFMSGAPPPSAGAAAAAKGPSLTPAQAIKFAKYEKMKKMLPDGAVRQKMTADGLSEEDISLFFAAAGGGADGAGAPAAGKAKKPAEPAEEGPPKGMKAKQKVQPGVKLKNLYWSKMKAEEVEGTIWNEVEDVHLQQEDSSLIEEWFAAKPTKTTDTKKEEKRRKSSIGPQLLSLLDGKRTQNVLIAMGKLRRSPEEIMQMIIDLDPNEMNPEVTASINVMLPTPDELAAVGAHSDPEKLDDASRVYFHFNRLPRLVQRVECHDIAFHWMEQAGSTMGRMKFIQNACSELSDAQLKLKELLSIMLTIGNYLNGNTRNGQAYGVKLDTVTKLTTLKSEKGSLLHLMAAMVEKKHPHLMDMSSQWVAIWAAAEISLKQLLQETNLLEVQINKVNSEFVFIREGKENRGLDGVLEDAKGPFMNPLFRRCDAFLNQAKPKLSQIKNLYRDVEQAVADRMKLFGEDIKAPYEDDPSQHFFTLIATFARNFRAALDDNIKKRMAEEKRERLARAAEAAALQRSKVRAAKKASIVKTPSDEGEVGENMFETFHKNQESSSEDMVRAFREKLVQRQSRKIVKQSSGGSLVEP